MLRLKVSKKLLCSCKMNMELILTPPSLSIVMRYIISFVHPQGVYFSVVQLMNLAEHIYSSYSPPIINRLQLLAGGS